MKAGRDWGEVRARLTSLAENLEEDQSLASLFEQRAQRLLEQSNEAAQPSAEYLIFRIESAQLGVALAPVRGVHSVVRFSPVPGSHPAVTGVTSLRGRILPLVDPAALLHPDAPRQARSRFVLLHHRGLELGLAADAIVGIEGGGALLPLRGGTQALPCSGLLEPSTSIVDLDALLRLLGVPLA